MPKASLEWNQLRILTTFSVKNEAQELIVLKKALELANRRINALVKAEEEKDA